MTEEVAAQRESFFPSVTWNSGGGGGEGGGWDGKEKMILYSGDPGNSCLCCGTCQSLLGAVREAISWVSILMMVHLPEEFGDRPPFTKQRPHPPQLNPNETPCLLPLLWGMHTNRETGEGRQTEPRRPLEPPPLDLNHQTHPHTGPNNGPDRHLPQFSPT